MPSEKEIEAGIEAAKKITLSISSSQRAGAIRLRNYDEVVKEVLEAAEKVRWQPIETVDEEIKVE